MFKSGVTLQVCAENEVRHMCMEAASLVSETLKVSKNLIFFIFLLIYLALGVQLTQKSGGMDLNPGFSES